MALHKIGASKPAADAIDALLECHVRIRHFVGLSGRLAEAEAEPLDQVAEVASAIHRYFSVALPLHAADEDESLLPRLRGKDVRLDAELERMYTDHLEHGEVLNPVLEISSRLSTHPGEVAKFGTHLGIAAVNLASHFAGHLRREEDVIFPAARKLLSADELAAIWAELRARRGEI